MPLPPSSEESKPVADRAFIYVDARLALLSEGAYHDLSALVAELLDGTLGFLVEGKGEEVFLTVGGLFLARICRLHDKR